MFTGIVEMTGTIAASRSTPTGRRLQVDANMPGDGCIPGASVCVSGVCLTVAGVVGSSLEFDVITETLRKSTLGSKRRGDRVNLERSLRVGDRFEGHFVQGHVDGIATIDRVDTPSGEYVVWMRPEAHLVSYVIPKGAVAVDGVSLTIADVRHGAFSVALIPTTLERTTLSSLAAGDRVNIESDIVVRTIVHRLPEILTRSSGWRPMVGDGGSDGNRRSSIEPPGLTVEKLREAGFA